MIYFKKYILFIFNTNNSYFSISQKSLDDINEKFKLTELQNKLDKELNNHLFTLAIKSTDVDLEELKKTTYTDNYINLPVGPNFSNTLKISGRECPDSILDKILYYGICYEIVSCLHLFIPELDFNLYLSFIPLDEIDSFIDELYSISSLQYMSYEEEINSLREKYYNDNKEYNWMNSTIYKRIYYIFKLIVFLYKFQKKYYPLISEDFILESTSLFYIRKSLFKNKKYDLIIKRIVISFFTLLDNYIEQFSNISFSCFQAFIKAYYEVDDNNKLTPLFSRFDFSNSVRTKIYYSLLTLMSNFLINSLGKMLIPHTSYNCFISLEYLNILFDNEDYIFNYNALLCENENLNFINYVQEFNFGKYFFAKILEKMKTSKIIRRYIPYWHKYFICLANESL